MNKSITSVIITDCGSTTTKARLFELKDGRWRFIARGEAPTTVEAPLADVTIGVRNSIIELGEITGRNFILDKDIPWNHDNFDLYLSTSSAGGGLQMLVCGAVAKISAQSAERAALGAGAIVLDVISADDEREEHALIETIRKIRPDITLIAGGTDGGAENFVVSSAELLRAAKPKPRFGTQKKGSVIYAGNKSAAPLVKHILEDTCDIQFTQNVRPSIELENIHPVREAIHDLFLTHVMSQSPGYDKLLSWTPNPILPTPSAVGVVIEAYAKRSNKSVIAVDIGGATTDIFSVFKDTAQEFQFHRTVSANYGMSYSIAQVLIEAGVDLVARWLPYKISESSLRERIRNKMVRPTTIPQSFDDLLLEHAMCREALRLSLDHHKSFATELSGQKKERTIGDLFLQKSQTESLVSMNSLDCVIGSGGVLSHAPHRGMAALMLIDGFRLEGVTEIMVDSAFLLPHLGALSEVMQDAAIEILEKDCLVPIGVCVAPSYRFRKNISKVASVFWNGDEVGTVEAGKIKRVPVSGNGEIIVEPSSSSVDVGNGAGEKYIKKILVGDEGLFLDGRNRPITNKFSPESQLEIHRSLGIL